MLVFQIGNAHVQVDLLASHGDGRQFSFLQFSRHRLPYHKGDPIPSLNHLFDKLCIAGFHENIRGEAFFGK